MGKHDFYLELVDKKGREDLFATVRTIKEFMTLKLNTLEILLSQWSGKQSCEQIKLPYLHVEDQNLHRVFIVSNNKIVSFGFGFHIQAKENNIKQLIFGKYRFSTKDISDAHAIVHQINDSDLYKDISFEGNDDSPDINGIRLFEHLLFEEPSYLRYDYDKQSAQGNRSKIHPAHHFDFCFTPDFTYKLGLPKQINEMEFQRILLATDYCRFLSLKYLEPRVSVELRYKGRKIKLKVSLPPKVRR